MTSVPSGLRVAVAFGGPSVEHDVSIISAQQAIAVLGERHVPIPVYLAPDGRWWSGEELTSVQAFAQQPPRGAQPIELRLGGGPDAEPFTMPAQSRLRGARPVAVDVLLNAIHGTGGEDGALLGALELAGVPHVGSGVAASAIAMNKHLAKAVLSAAGLDVLPEAHLERADWEGARAATLERVLREIPLPCVVKPAALGSSIGVTRCATEAELADALELAFELDRQAVVEPFAAGAIELNAAVLGRPGGELRVSEVERPLGGVDGLTFEDKYLSSAGGKGGKGGGAKGGAGAKHGGGGAKQGGEGGMAAQDRIIPADVDPELRRRVQEQAARAHRALGIAGVVRYDFFVLEDGARVVLNEPNTVPGSFAFYLFEPVGLPFPELLDELLAIALAEAREERSTTRTFASSLLQRHTVAS